VLFYIARLSSFGPPSPPAMEIKFKLDTKKATHAAVAIAAVYALCRVSEHSNSPQLAAANAIALIVIIAFLYGPHQAPTKTN
jgi:hypothetical protein